MSFNPKNPETVDLLLNRRSGKARRMTDPGPNSDELRKILLAGQRVPDHGKLAPWRFIVFKGRHRKKFGDLLRTEYVASEEDFDQDKAEDMRKFPEQAPVMIAVVFTPSDARPIPEFEQLLSTGAACQNIIIAANALGFVTCWLTGWAARSESVNSLLELGKKDRIAGYIFIGTYPGPLRERPRPDFDEIVRFWRAD